MANKPLCLLLAVSVLAVPAAAQEAPPPSLATTGDVTQGDTGASASEGTSRAPRSGRRARIRTEIQPYLEVDQTVTADLGDDGEVFTYTTLAAGVEGRMVTRRVTAQVGYRYERQISWDGDLPDDDRHSGIAAIAAEVVPGRLNVEAAAVATRTAGPGRVQWVTDIDPAINVYGAYAGPTLSTEIGDVAVNASYRLGYVAVDDDSLTGGLDRGDFDSVSHSASASVGQAPGRLPVGWTVGAGYVRDESGTFDDRFEGSFVRADVVAPVTPTVALTAGVGYETITASQSDFARDANGVPIITTDNRLLPDPSRPRLLTYETDGFIYDAGVIWRPSRRTELQARAGYRYGGFTAVGTFEHRIDDRWGVGAAVFDTVETFGRSLVNGLNNLPEDLDIAIDPISNGYLSGCLTGDTPGTGVCLDPVLSSVRGGTFRARGANLVVSGGSGRWDYGVGASYVHRRYARASIAQLVGLLPGEDQSVTVSGTLNRALSRTSNANLLLYGSWYDSDLAGDEAVFSTGVTAGYNRRFLFDRLQLLTALGLYYTDTGNDDSTVATGRAGVRYTF